MMIVTNIRRFPTAWQARTGERGESVVAATPSAVLEQVEQRPDAVVVVDDLALMLVLARRLYRRRSVALVGVDPVLRRPRSLRNHVHALYKRIVLGRLDHFIHYFRDLRGLQEVYGIGPERSSFVPFKPNSKLVAGAPAGPDGDYILCIGRSLRDYDTFFEAIDGLPYTGAITRPDFAGLKEHGSRFTRALSALPDNVIVLEDEHTLESLTRILSKARLVMLPIVKGSLVASGIGICLDSLLLGKCVVLSLGPGTTDIFTNGEILTVEPENAAALAAAMRRGCEDEALRREMATKGQAYAAGLGGEPELYQRIIDAVATWRRARHPV